MRDIFVTDNGSQDVIFIFGCAHGGYDFGNISEMSRDIDVISIRNPSRNWYQTPTADLPSLSHLDCYIKQKSAGYSGAKIFCGLSMGGSAALYFGSQIENAHIYAASPQIYDFQFRWSADFEETYDLVEALPSRLLNGRYASAQIITCSGGRDPDCDWKDREAAVLAHHQLGVEIEEISCSGHGVWLHFSMRKKIEALLGRPLFLDSIDFAVA